MADPERQDPIGQGNAPPRRPVVAGNWTEIRTSSIGGPEILGFRFATMTSRPENRGRSKIDSSGGQRNRTSTSNLVDAVRFSLRLTRLLNYIVGI